MTSFKQESSSTTHFIGQDWQKLIDMIESRPGDNEVKPFDEKGSLCQYRAEDSVLRTLQDVKRLRQKDMPLFGRCPETDNFYTVVCSICSMILMPHALKVHCEKRHGDSNKSYSIGDKQNIDSPTKGKSRKIIPEKIVKPEKIDKSKKIKSSSLLDLSEDIFKDSRRVDKPKKGKSTEKTFESENTVVTSKTEKTKQKSSRIASELQPIAPLSPIQVEENEIECRSKNKKRDKKKNERKVDKTYDPDKHCGVINDNGKPCVRSILCKVHQVALKRAVSNRTVPYDMLIRLLKNQNDDEKVKCDNDLLRLSKVESTDRVLPETQELQNGEVLPVVQANKVWTEDQISIKTEEPPTKRLRFKEETIDDDVDQNQFALPSHLEALIDETLKTLKDDTMDEGEPISILPIVPKSEPLVKWNFGIEIPPKIPSPPPIVLDDIHWHSSHPKPLATNTFGCRLIGGLMSTCKKLDTLRKHLQSVWSSGSSTPNSIRSSFNDVYPSNNAQNTSISNANSKNYFPFSKCIKKPIQNKSSTLLKRIVPPVLPKGSTIKRKRRSNHSIVAPVQNSIANASDIISGLLISNPVPVQRTVTASIPTIPTGVIPVNSITGNGVPLRLFQGSLPVIASTSPNQPATFIQLNLCPPK